ncbi:hypothetical protein PG997_005945 [Apiospora hydei]|uniref:Uncharacterized protein n=1 Tax=Apiospora hydei TaxID=1337664 RepID=A0ABR1WME9_9PEZI
MASGRFVDPMTLLRVTPLVTSTAAVMFSVDQYLFLDNLLAPPHREQMNELVPSYYKTFFRKGIWVIMTAYPLSIATGIANVYRSSGGTTVAAKLSDGNNGAGRWYAAGAALAFAHYAFVPSIMYKVQALFEGEGKGEGEQGPQAVAGRPPGEVGAGGCALVALLRDGLPQVSWAPVKKGWVGV